MAGPSLRHRGALSSSSFDFDLSDGRFAEDLLIALFSNERGRVEVKRDLRVSDTGNVAIEYRSRKKKSGIATTTAVWWALVLDGPHYGHQIIVFIKTERLKQLARQLYTEGSKARGGDDGTSEMVLIPVHLLVTWVPTVVTPDLL